MNRGKPIYIRRFEIEKLVWILSMFIETHQTENKIYQDELDLAKRILEELI